MPIVRARRQEPEASPSVAASPCPCVAEPVHRALCVQDSARACISWLLLRNKHSSMEQLTPRAVY